MFGFLSEILFAFAPLLQEGQVAPAESLLPMAGPLPGATVVFPPTVDFIRPNPYDVWQAYSVDRYGRFRARVVPTPLGLRYVYNGAPHPWWPTSPQNSALMLVQSSVFEQAPHDPVVIIPAPAP
jgi:hypothetical protein